LSKVLSVKQTEILQALAVKNQIVLPFDEKDDEQFARRLLVLMLLKATWSEL
jgi:hypothetical protein